MRTMKFEIILTMLVARISMFESAQERHAKVGARDTEPDSQFQKCLMRALEGHDPQVPTDGAGWQLFRPDPDDGDDQITDGMVAAAVSDLTGAANACVAEIRCLDSLPRAEAREVAKYIRNYCWRC